MTKNRMTKKSGKKNKQKNDKKKNDNKKNSKKDCQKEATAEKKTDGFLCHLVDDPDLVPDALPVQEGGHVGGELQQLLEAVPAHSGSKMVKNVKKNF